MCPDGTGDPEMILDDETLGAYADGELDGTKARQVEAALLSDAAARARLEEIYRVTTLVRAALHSLAEPIPQPLIDSVRNAEQQSSRPEKGLWPLLWTPSWGLTLGSLAAGAVIGISAFVLLQTPPAPVTTNPRGENLSAIHAGYSDLLKGNQPSALDIRSSDPAELESVMRQLFSDRQYVPELSRRGYSLAGGRTSPGPDGETFTVIYQKAPQRTLTYSIHKSQARSRAVSPARHGSSLISWQKGGYEYSLYGNENQRELGSIAVEISESPSE
ncbi:MAG: anti-sigma factor family protein [Gammaproteobacteria bacterium]